MTAVIPSREGAATKARRYLCEGRLTVLSVHAGRIWAECRGDGETYQLGYAHGRWHCSCPARTIDCAHLRALRLVADRPERASGA
jgi:uncharacterized Zn finger protein